MSVSGGLSGTNPRFRIVLRSVYIEGILDDGVRLWPNPEARWEVSDERVDIIETVTGAWIIERPDSINTLATLLLSSFEHTDDSTEKGCFGP